MWRKGRTKSMTQDQGRMYYSGKCEKTEYPLHIHLQGCAALNPKKGPITRCVLWEGTLTAPHVLTDARKERTSLHPARVRSL